MVLRRPYSMATTAAAAAILQTPGVQGHVARWCSRGVSAATGDQRKVRREAGTDRLAHRMSDGAVTECMSLGGSRHICGDEEVLLIVATGESAIPWLLGAIITRDNNGSWCRSSHVTPHRAAMPIRSVIAAATVFVEPAGLPCRPDVANVAYLRAWQ